MKLSEISSVQSSVQKENVKGNNIDRGEKLDRDVHDHVKQEVKEKKEENKFSREKIQESIEEMNDTVSALHKELHFEFHDKAERMLVEIRDIRNDEVIKEIPPKEMLDMIGRIKEVVGLLLDEKI